MTKIINLVGILLVTVTIVYIFINFTSVSERNIDNLQSHFEKSGLNTSSSKPLTENEQGLVDAANQLKQAVVGQTKSDTLVDSRHFMIGSIPIKIYEFKDSKLANEYYTNALAREVRREERNRANRSLQTKNEFSLKENLVMQISYYEINLHNGSLVPTILELDASEVSRVKQAFQNY